MLDDSFAVAISTQSPGVGSIYLAFLCPYTLIEDEAHYWEWSRRLDWSYYSKGPGIAVLIRASTEFFHLFGMEKTELAVRAPAAIFGSVLVIAVGLLALRTTRNAHAGIIAAVLVLFTPAFQASALLMTIDPQLTDRGWKPSALLQRQESRLRRVRIYKLA